MEDIEREKAELEEKERAEMEHTMDEIQMLKKILDDIVKDLPDPAPSIMYVPIEPKMDAFMSKDLDSFLAGMELKLGTGEEDEREDT